MTALLDEPQAAPTNASWAASQPIAQGAPRSRSRLIIAAAALVALLGAVGVIGALMLANRGDPLDAASSAQESASTTPIDSSPAGAIEPAKAAAEPEPASEPSAAPSASSEKKKRTVLLPTAKPSASNKPRDFGY
jgi:hypothetical protein